MDRLKGKVALVTGGASGIGRRSAERMAGEGARVAITDVNAEGGRAAAAEIGGDVVFVEHDVTDEAAWRRATARTLERFGRLDVAVDSAGVGTMGTVEDTSRDPAPARPGCRRYRIEKTTGRPREERP